MKQILNIICFAAVFVMPLSSVAIEGTVRYGSFVSETLDGEEKHYQIYLPPGYDSSTDSYPVVYRLGWFFTDNFSLLEVVDQMISAGLIEPIILVKPCGRPSAPRMGRWMEFPDNTYMPNYMDSPVMGDYQTYLVEDVVTHIDATYRTIADRDHRGICGGSGGAAWAMRPALRHPDVFGRVVGVATVLDWRGFEGLCGVVAQAQGYRPIDEYEPSSNDLTGDLLSVAGHYLPSLNNPPWYVDYPCTASGQPIPELWEEIDRRTARGVAETLFVPDLDLRIGIFAASNDQFDADDSARRFADVLDAQGAAYTLRIYESNAPDPHDDYRPEVMISFFHPLLATVELEPRVIDAVSWWLLVQATLELPGDLQVEEIDPSSLAITEIDGIRLDHPIRAFASHDLGDLNGNGRADLTVWFDKRPLLRALLAMGIEDLQSFEITIAGELESGRFLAASDRQRAVNLDHPATRALLMSLD